jgi:parallel beta-helix repeat protein
MNALTGTGVANLCPGAVFDLTGPVSFSSDNQEIRTEGYPVDNKALLRVKGLFPTAINGKSRSGVKLKNIIVDGGRAPNGDGYTNEHGALIVIGGNASGQVVDRVKAYEPRNWSTLQIIQGDVPSNCSNASITNNELGPAGQPDGTWADGISLGCINSTVSGNTITDATDGGIVIFGAPGSTVSGNTVVADTRRMLSGIALVDYAPFGGDFNGTVVANNYINAYKAQIVVAMPMGPRTWGCAASPRNRGAQVINNMLDGNNMGYGFVADGVENWWLAGNVSHARHSGAPVTGAGCGGQPPVPPAAFLRGSDADNSFRMLQSEFGAPAYVQNLPFLGPPQ